MKKLQTKSLDKVPVQKLVYKELVSKQFNIPLQNHIRRKLNEAFHPYDLDFCSDSNSPKHPDGPACRKTGPVSLDACFACLRKCGVPVAIKVLKGWCNGWATSRRYQETVKLPCLFGCSNECDELYHYLQCPHMFAIWSFLCEGVSEDPLVRWGLVNPSPEGMTQIACTFAGYHAIRRHFKQHGELTLHADEKMSGPHLRAAWTVFADAFAVEARELSVNFRKLSVPSFFKYLNGIPCNPTNLRITDGTNATSVHPPGGSPTGTLSDSNSCLMHDQELALCCSQTQGRGLSAEANLPVINLTTQ